MDQTWNTHNRCWSACMTREGFMEWEDQSPSNGVAIRCNSAPLLGSIGGGSFVLQEYHINTINVLTNTATVQVAQSCNMNTVHVAIYSTDVK